jgi:HEAT repeat protein
MRQFAVMLVLAASVWGTAMVRAQEDPFAEQPPTVEELIAVVSGDDADAALAAIDELGGMGPSAATATAALSAALKHENADIRRGAAKALGGIGEGAKAAVETLTEALGDDVPAVRAYAAFALGRIGKPAESAATKLVECAFDSDELVRRAALRAIRSINPPAEVTEPLVMKILEEGDPSVIMPALHTLAEDGVKAVPRLRERLKHERAAYWACVVLAAIGPEAKDAVPELVEVLGNQDPDTRMQALLALGEIGPDAKAAVPAILKSLQTDEFDDVRNAAAFALGRIGQQSDEINAALVAAAKSGKPFLRLVSLWAIARINPQHLRAVQYAADVIVDALKSDDKHLRQAAAQALSEFGDHPLIVGPALIAALENADPQVVANAINALAQFGDKLLPRLEARLQDKGLRHYALRVLGRMGPKAAPAVPSLIAALGADAETDDDKTFQREVAYTLAAIGPAAKEAIPALIEMLASDNHEIVQAACFVLGKIGPDAKDAVPTITELLDEQDAASGVVFVWALLKISPEDQEIKDKAVPLLIKGLTAEFDLARAEAAAALGEIGPSAASAVEPLKQLLNDPVPQVQAAATAALKKIQPTDGTE